MEKLVSVIVPIYNVENYLAECLNSIINQEYQNLEIILVDDGSTDKSGLICDEYAKNDFRIKVIHKDNGGISSARNAGIDIASGDYISFVDSDDVVSKYFITNLLDIALNHNVDIVQCQYTNIPNDLYSSSFNKYSQIDLIDKKEMIIKLNTTSYEKFVSVWSKLYKKYLFNNIRFPEGKIIEDAFVAYKVFWACKTEIAVTNRKLYYYRIRDNSIMHKKFSIKRYDALEGCEEEIDFFAKEEERDLIKATKVIYQKHLKDFWYKTYNEIDDNKKLYLDILLKKSRKNYFDILFNRYFSLKGKIKISAFNISPKLYYKFIDFLRKIKLEALVLAFRLRYSLYCLKTIKRKKYILFGIPKYSNIGNQAICISTKKLLKDINIKYIGVNSLVSSKEAYISRIKKIISKETIICVFGGRFIGTLWEGGEKILKNIATNFKDNKIIVFPQTVFYDDSEIGEKLKKEDSKLFSSCKDLNFFWREKNSYKIGKSLFTKNNNFLCPDMVLYLDQIENKQSNGTKNKILMCFRNDKEKINDIAITNDIIENKFELDYTDMVINKRINSMNRKKNVYDKIKQFTKYDLVITDRLHGMILSMLAKTPCIALDNVNHKVSGVYEAWLTDNKAIKLLTNIEEIEKNINDMISIKDCSFEINKNLYKELKEKLLN